MKTKTLFVSLLWAASHLQAGYERDAPDLSRVDFAAECTAISDPSDRWLFEHEEVLDDFLAVQGAFGSSRGAFAVPGSTVIVPEGSSGAIIVDPRPDAPPLTFEPAFVPASSPLVKHGSSSRNLDHWQVGETGYSMSYWGLAGSLGDKEPKMYRFVGRLGREADQGKLDAFDAYALAQLAKGEKLVKWERPGFVRLMGAVRCETVCTKCHEGKQGDLLGAFSYLFDKYKSNQPHEIHQVLAKAYQEGKSLREVAELFTSLCRTGTADAATQSHVVFMLKNAGIITPEALRTQRSRREEVLQQVGKQSKKEKSSPP